MPTLHAIIRTDLCEETIVETYTKAEDAAAFMDRQPDGAPFRIAALAEAVEPTKFMVTTTFNNDEGALHLGRFRHVAPRADAYHYAGEAARAGGSPKIYGLVPVEG